MKKTWIYLVAGNEEPTVISCHSSLKKAYNAIIIYAEEEELKIQTTLDEVKKKLKVTDEFEFVYVDTNEGTGTYTIQQLNLDEVANGGQPG